MQQTNSSAEYQRGSQSSSLTFTSPFVVPSPFTHGHLPDLWSPNTSFGCVRPSIRPSTKPSSARDLEAVFALFILKSLSVGLGALLYHLLLYKEGLRIFKPAIVLDPEQSISLTRQQSFPNHFRGTGVDKDRTRRRQVQFRILEFRAQQHFPPHPLLWDLRSPAL